MNVDTEDSQQERLRLCDTHVKIVVAAPVGPQSVVKPQAQALINEPDNFRVLAKDGSLVEFKVAEGGYIVLEEKAPLDAQSFLRNYTIVPTPVGVDVETLTKDQNTYKLISRDAFNGTDYDSSDAFIEYEVVADETYGPGIKFQNPECSGRLTITFEALANGHPNFVLVRERDEVEVQIRLPEPKILNETRTTFGDICCAVGTEKTGVVFRKGDRILYIPADDFGIFETVVQDENGLLPNASQDTLAKAVNVLEVFIGDDGLLCVRVGTDIIPLRDLPAKSGFYFVPSNNGALALTDFAVRQGGFDSDSEWHLPSTSDHEDVTEAPPSAEMTKAFVDVFSRHNVNCSLMQNPYNEVLHVYVHDKDDHNKGQQFMDNFVATVKRFGINDDQIDSGSSYLTGDITFVAKNIIKAVDSLRLHDHSDCIELLGLTSNKIKPIIRLSKNELETGLFDIMITLSYQ